MRVTALFVCLSMSAAAQEHNHGKHAIPDWYDSACCNQRDCKPVADGDVEFADMDGPIVRYKPTGNVFHRSQFRRSQDERYHVCINPAGTSLCFYDRAGM